MQKLIENIQNLDNFRKNIIKSIIDSIIIITTLIFSFLITNNAHLLPNYNILVSILLTPIYGIPIFIKFNVYRSITSKINLDLFGSIFFSSSIINLFFLIISYFLYQSYLYINILLVNILLLSVVIFAIRIFVRNLFTKINFKFEKNDIIKKNVIIYGAGKNGVDIIRLSSFLDYHNVICFVDDDQNIQNKMINSIPIKSSQKIESIILENDIDEIILAIPSMSNERKKEIFYKFEDFHVSLKVCPDLSKIDAYSSQFSFFKDIELSDIVLRKKSEPNQELLKKNIDGKVALVTGAGGSIARNLINTMLLLNPSKIILLEQNEFFLYELKEKLSNHKKIKKCQFILGSVNDYDLIKKIIKENGINIIFHTAAYKHVPLVEENIISALNNNFFSTKNIIDCAISNNVKNFVFVSTDKAVDPENIMGATKRLGEIYIQIVAQKYLINYCAVRFGNVLSSSGSVIPLFTRQIEEGGPITITDKEMTRYFMTLEEASELIIQSSAINSNKGIFILDMGQPVKIFDIAKRLIRLSGRRYGNDEKDDNVIPIEIVGKRKGEKIHEKLSSSMDFIDTEHPKIKICNEDYPDEKKFVDLCNILKKKYF